MKIKAPVLLLLLAATLCRAAPPPLPLTFTVRQDITLHLPAGWMEIPQREIAYQTDLLRIARPDAPPETFDSAYQLESALRWFEYPYLTVQIQPVGKSSRPASQVLAELKQRFLREIQEEAALPASPAAQQMEQMFDWMAPAASNTAAAPLPAVTEAEAEERAGLDETHRFAWMIRREQPAGSGPVATFLAISLTEAGILRIGLAVPEEQTETFRPLFFDIVRAIQYSPRIQYRPAAAR